MQWLKDRKIHNGPFSLFFVIPAFYASLSHRLEPASSLNKGQTGQALRTPFHKFAHVFCGRFRHSRTSWAIVRAWDCDRRHSAGPPLLPTWGLHGSYLATDTELPCFEEARPSVDTHLVNLPDRDFRGVKGSTSADSAFLVPGGVRRGCWQP